MRISDWSSDVCSSDLALGAEPLDHFEHRAVDLGDDLDHAVMVAQIDEDEVAVIALAMYPTRDTDGFPGAVRAKLAAGMGALGVHDGISDCFTPSRAGVSGRGRETRGRRTRTELEGGLCFLSEECVMGKECV